MKRGALFVIIFCFLVMGLGCYGKVTKENERNNVTKESSLITDSGGASQEQVKKQEEKIPIVLYFSDKQVGKLIAEKREIPKSAVLNKLEETIVSELLKGPSKPDMLATIPKDTKLLSIKKDGGTFVVNFSKEFVENHPGGSAGETLTLYSIVNSLTELKEIEKVKFLIEGQERKEYKGHYQFDVPFTRNEEIIDKT